MSEHYLCLDLEMSGQIPGVHDVIQIGAVLLDDKFEQISTFESLIYPENEADFDPGSKRIHGISRFELEEAPSLEETIEDLEYWLQGEGGFPSRKAMCDIKICGQGINNDISFLKASYETVNLTWPFAYQYIDLQDIMLFYKTILEANGKEVPKGLGLNAIAEYLDMERTRNKHNALEDAELTGYCLSELFRRAKEVKLH
ncbi:DNA polymerase-3 subunit epsilon [Draconibacterium orientale]|uniref:DNA polymerase III n=1 Tax=Draconibacterium orientale TaxID=1168034 RepID=X5E064_9BACT|nr:3'-5' exonuclease [Draconibacterium orientale]AHW59956.1 DNA polymerase III [Draconibacterium orientale]SET40777.1 DNA polymerase-3 subunit epsilon [Draconibacterium orientale]